MPTCTLRISAIGVAGCPPLRAVGLGLILMVVLVLYVQSTKGSGQGNTVGLIFTMGVLMPTLIVLGCFMKRTINGGQV